MTAPRYKPYNLGAARKRGIDVIERMRIRLAESERLTGRRNEGAEDIIAEWDAIMTTFVAAGYLLNHSKKLVDLLGERGDLTEAEQQEVDYLKQNLIL